MKTSYLYLFSLLIIPLCCFSCERVANNNEGETEEENYPVDIAFTEYLLTETSCGWIMEKFNYSNEVLVINSQEEMENYLFCLQPQLIYPNETCPEIDFSTHSLLLANGSAGYAISSLAKNLQQVSAGKFQLDVAIELNDTPIYERWIIGLVTSKLGEESIVELNVTLCDEEENYPLDNPFTEYSVWRYTDDRVVLELQIYPENRMHQESTPPDMRSLGEPYYRWSGNSISDYIIKEDTLLRGSKIENNYTRGWNIIYISENEVYLRYIDAISINIDPLLYISIFRFTRQTCLK